jgi:hypothetical protein
MAFNLKNVGAQGKQMAKLLQIQRQLSKKKIVLEEDGLKVVVTADMKIREIEINGERKDDLVKLLNKAIKESQRAMAEVPQLSSLMSGLR